MQSYCTHAAFKKHKLLVVSHLIELTIVERFFRSRKFKGTVFVKYNDDRDANNVLAFYGRKSTRFLALTKSFVIHWSYYVSNTQELFTL